MPFDPSATRSGAVPSTNPTYQAAWVCYINGVEVPIVGFDMSCGVWQPPTFDIFMVPDITLQRLGAEDRVPVQIFYLDYWYDPTKPEFRLLVDGEIIGWRYSTAFGSVSMAFSCISHIHVFQQLYFHFMSSVDDIVAAQSPENQALAVSEAGLLYPYSLFHQGLFVTPDQVRQATPTTASPDGTVPPPPTPEAQTTPDTAQIQAPFELVYNVIKGIISTGVPNNRRAIPMMNFFARHVRKTRLHNRFVRLPLLEDPEVIANKRGVFPIFNAARADEALNAMQRHVVGQVGNAGPIWNLLQQTLGSVYMEIAMIPNPAVVLVQLNQPGTSTTQTPAGGADTPTPDAQTGNTQTVVDGKIIGTLLPRTQLSELALPISSVPQAQQTQAQQAIAGGRNVEPRLPITAPNPATPVRLAQYFVKPQFLFAIPPACNIIFPSMIQSWTYDEPYMPQPTRVYVNDSVMTRLLRARGSDREFMLHALTVGWPEEANAIMTHKTENPAYSMTSGKNLLIWPEEYYKGPVLAKFDLPSWFQMLQQFMNARPNSTGDTSNASAPSTTPAPAITPILDSPELGNPVAQQPPQYLPAPPLVRADAEAGGPFAGPVTGTGPGRQPTRFYLNNGFFSDRRNRNAFVQSAPRYELSFGPSRFNPDNGGGLDPNFYIRPAITLLYQPKFVLGTQERRGGVEVRALNPAIASNPSYEEPSLQLRWAQIWRLFEPFLQGIPITIDGDNQPKKKYALMLGIFFQLIREWTDSPIKNWRFGNVRQYATSRPANWTIQVQPGQGGAQPYQAAVSAEAGAFNHVQRLLRSYSGPIAIQAMLNGGSLDPQLNAIFRAYDQTTGGAALKQKFERENIGPIRPDYFYIALGYGPDNLVWLEAENQVNGRRAANTQANRNIFTQNAVTSSSFGVGYWYDVLYRLSTVERDKIPPENRYVQPLPTRSLLENEAARDLLIQNASVPVIPPRTAIRPFRRNPMVPMPGTGLPFVPPPSPPKPATEDKTGEKGKNTQPPSTGAGTQQVDSAETTTDPRPFKELFALYAQYEYLRSRYIVRTAGAVLQFNPYLVPGFPSMMFDRMANRFHIVGYIQNLRHTASAEGSGSISTSVNFTCCRTLPEFINDVKHDARRFNGRVTAAPADVIEDIRRYTQDENEAEKLYQRLFYGARPRTNGQPAAFRWDKALGYSEGLTEGQIIIEGASVSRQIDIERGDAISGLPEATGGAAPEDVTQNPDTQVRENLNPNLELSPRERNVKLAFLGYDAAMQLASRPACSLVDYIRFWHGGMALQDLIRRNIVKNAQTQNFGYLRTTDTTTTVVEVEDNDPNRATFRERRTQNARAAAVYYDQIFELRPGPGTEPAAETRGYTDPPNITPSTTFKGVGSDYPQTRATWNVVLEAYRNKVRKKKSPNP